MEYKFKPQKISRKNFFDIKEEDVMFITNPGRIGDVDGSTFIIKKDNNYITYRMDGWMYGNHSEKEFISFNEALKQFPKWKESWDNCDNEKYDGKYVYVYAGYGFGIAIDKSIYKEFEPYLTEEVEKIRIKFNKDKIEPAMYSPAWRSAVEKMLSNK